MEKDKNRFKALEKAMTITLLGITLIFILFLIASGCGIIWLKVILAIITAAACILCLAYLYITKLLIQPRSLWMTTAAASILACLLFSLILNFPSPL